MANIKIFKTGEKIVAEGIYGEETFRIIEGQVVISKETGQKAPVILAELGPNEVFGEMYIFDNAGFRSASAVARSEVKVEIIQRNELEEELEKAPLVIKDMLKSMNRRLEGTSQEYSLTLLKKLEAEDTVKKLLIAMVAGLVLAEAYQIYASFS